MSSLLWPAPRPLPAHLVHIPAFFAALILAPILFAALTFWAAFIPVMAIGFGGLPYLLVGGPVLWCQIQRHGPRADFVSAAFLANLIATPILTALVITLSDAGPPDPGDLLGGITFMTVFGMLIAPFWGLTFGWLYRKFTK